MSKRIGVTKRALMIQDILNARHDMVALASAHKLTPDELARWISQSENQQCLRGLCVLADLQTQLLLSRYRLLAASRLIKLATEDGSGDVARRACVDLLRVDLKRADAAEDSGEESTGSSALREALYGASDEHEEAGKHD